MQSFARYSSCVECLLAPLLKERVLVAMPCKHSRTFEIAKQERRRRYEELGLGEPDCDDLEEPPGYCDCVRFNRRTALWDIGDFCVKYGLNRTQMRHMAAILLLITKDTVTYNVIRRTMHDLFGGAYKDFIRAYSKKRDDGASFEEAVAHIVPRWQFRMMPNA